MAKRDKPIYLVVRRMVDIATGEEVGALVPNSWIDRRLMRERDYTVGTLLRATLTNPRNSKFHRLVHQLGTLVKQNIEGYESLDSHAVIKRLQREAGVFCEEQEIEIPSIGKLLVKVAQSIAFDSLDESEFHQLWAGICNYLIERHWQSLDIDQITAMAELMPQREAA